MITQIAKRRNQSNSTNFKNTMKLLVLLSSFALSSVWRIPLVFVVVVVVTVAASKDEEQSPQHYDLTAPWYGATPAKKSYEMHRRGWDACLRCGGADRLGATVHVVGRLQDLNDATTAELLDAVRAHGIIVIKGQNLTRADQVEFTSRLGETIVLPASFEGQDPEPFHPAIQRITNFWANGTWKGPSAKFGAY